MLNEKLLVFRDEKCIVIKKKKNKDGQQVALRTQGKGSQQETSQRCIKMLQERQNHP